jgi:quinol monooxygenase YgiN
MSYVLQVDLKIKPGNIDAFMKRCIVNATAARSEPGCQRFDVIVDPADPTHVMLYEIYDDAKAFEAHQQTAAFKVYLAEAVPLLASRERHVWTLVDS